MPWNDNLEDPWLDVVATNDTPLRICAGPGTGKTFTLIRRIARLLESGETPSTILACTFTRTAAGDLLRELKSLNINRASYVRASTIHAFCFGVLAQSKILEITDRVLRPLFDYETRFLIQDLGKKFGTITEREKQMKAFEAAWARRQSERPGSPQCPIDQNFQRQVLDWLKFHKAMLIGELIPEALRYLRNNPASSEHTDFSHVLVDEYQDLNVAEQELIQHVSQNAKLTIIGDEDQSIYAFKHAHPEGIASFHEQHPDTVDKTLDQCRRCPKRIIKMANKLISHNQDRTDRVLKARPKSDAGVVHIVQWPNMEQETQGLTELIWRYIDSEQITPGQILVLTPRRALGDEIYKSLKEKGISARNFFQEELLKGEPKKLKKCQAQQAVTLLTLAANPEDHVALRCWCGFGSPQLLDNSWSRVRRLAAENNISLVETLESVENKQLTLPYGKQLIKRLQELRNKLDHFAPLRGSALVDALFPEDNPDVLQIRAMIGNLELDADASQILKRLRTAMFQPESPADVDYVRVMSIHKSKGLTADLVVVMGCIDSIIPALSQNTSPKAQHAELEEQRRLFYVAITRTRKVLILSSARSLPRKYAHRMRMHIRNKKGTMAIATMSRFIDEFDSTKPAPITGEHLLSLGKFGLFRSS